MRYLWKIIFNNERKTFYLGKINDERDLMKAV